MRLFSSSSIKQSVSRLRSFVPSSCFNVKSSLLVRCQDLPAEINPITFLNLVTQQYRRFCPAGIVKCECMLAPGNYTEGPFYNDEDPVARAARKNARGNIPTRPKSVQQPQPPVPGQASSIEAFVAILAQQLPQQRQGR